jgi:hypothetical protein
VPPIYPNSFKPFHAKMSAAAAAPKPSMKFEMPSPGDFEAIPGMDSWEASMLKDIYDAVDAANCWDAMKSSAVESFMFHGPAWINQVHAHMKMFDQHSGSSYGITMRNVESIAKNGWEAYVNGRVTYYEEKLARKAAERVAAQAPAHDPQRYWARTWAAVSPEPRSRAETEEADLDARRQERRSSPERV